MQPSEQGCFVEGKTVPKKESKTYITVWIQMQNLNIMVGHLLQNSRSGHEYLFSTKISTTTFQRITLILFSFKEQTTVYSFNF